MRPDFNIFKKHGRENIGGFKGFFKGKYAGKPIWKYVLADSLR